MESILRKIQPDRKGFESDPFGYGSFAWHKWGLACTVAGFDVGIGRPPTTTDLKTPVLWLSQARALAEAATAVLRNEPEYLDLPDSMKGVCDCQYCAVGLMLVGYSLEVCLKAMLIMREGVEYYAAEEKKHRHHRLVELAEFIPVLSEKDKAILQALTHFVMWAGRYPDPGSGREGDTEEVFTLSEDYEISGKDLFELAGRVMSHAQCVVEETQ